MYSVHATITLKDSRGWTDTRDVPAFYIHSGLHGIRDSTHAANFARIMLLTINPAAQIDSLEVVESEVVQLQQVRP